MTKQEALVSIAQTILRVRYNADDLVRAGDRPTYDQIRRVVAMASNLVNPSDADCAYARLELNRRYTPAIVPYPGIVD
jgi:hypothetical protein